MTDTRTYTQAEMDEAGELTAKIMALFGFANGQIIDHKTSMDVNIAVMALITALASLMSSIEAYYPMLRSSDRIIAELLAQKDHNCAKIRQIQDKFPGGLEGYYAYEEKLNDLRQDNRREP